MKARVLKVIGVTLITVTLAVSFFAIPVYAADGYYTAQFPFPIAASDYFGFVLNESSLDSNLYSSFRRPNYVSDQSNYVNYEFKLPSSYVKEDCIDAWNNLVISVLDSNDENEICTGPIWKSSIESATVINTNAIVILRRFVFELNIFSS